MCPQTIRLVDDDSHRPGWFQMAADDYLARAVSSDSSDPVLRFYKWQYPTISLGFHQILEVIDPNACLEIGWDIVRRPTGGRALLHNGDLSYALILPAPQGGKTQLRLLYSLVAKAISDGLHEFGIYTSDNGLTRSGQSKVNLRVGVCLDTRVRGELLTDGKKITSAAQRLYSQSVLQHGSIPLTGQPSDIVKVLPLCEEEKEKEADKLNMAATTVSQLTESKVCFDDLASVLRKSFHRVLNFDLYISQWSDFEVEAIINKRMEFELMSCKRNNVNI